MKREIKERLEAVRQGEVPDGYRRAKLGIAPMEWMDCTLGDILTQRKTLMCVSEDAPLLSFTIEEGVIDPKNKKSNKRDFLIKDMATKKFALTEVGDIIYNPANLKFGAIHRNNLKRGVVSPIYGIFYGAPNSKFMGYFLHDQRFIDYAKTYTEGSVEKLKTLSADAFLKLKVTLPSLPEQKRITEILERCDRIIELKQALLKEKHHQKQWLMMKLLDPNSGVRVSGFTESEWRSCCLGDVTDIYSGGTPDTETAEFWNGNVLWCTPSDITCSGKYIDRTETTISELGLQKSSAVLMPAGSVLMCSRATIGPRVIAKVPIATNQGFKNFICKQTLDNEFLYYALETILPDLLKKAAGNTFKEVSKADVAKSTIEIPVLEEQQAIASRLIAADKEIELVAQELEAWQQKKKAMMQLLLTGLVRVNA